MPLAYGTELTGLLEAGSTTFGKLLLRNATAALNDLGESARKRVRVGIPRHGGDSLYNSMKLDRASITNPVFNVHSESPIAIFREVDTKPHIIVPVNKKALRFKVGRTVIFATKVNHPGTTGLHNWQYANQQVRQRLPWAMQAAIDATLNLMPYAKRYS